MDKLQNAKKYDLEERTYNFAKFCRNYANNLPRTSSNCEYASQLIRSSGSQAANYIEANEALSKKDFQMRVKICRKETKESSLWLRLSEPKTEEDNEKLRLIQESSELRKIFSSILENSK